MHCQTQFNSYGGYDDSLFAELARVEDRHFWFRARNVLIYELAKRLCAGLEPGYRVLEVGCGNGNVLSTLSKACAAGVVVGIERYFSGLPFARRRFAGPLVQGDARQLPFGRDFHLIAMFDVLEHIPEEDETLSSLRGMLAPEGRLILTVPAHQFLWSYFDEAAHHCRRYSPQSLRNSLSRNGFEVEFLSQFMATIFPLVWLFRKISGTKGITRSEDAKRQALREFGLVPVVNSVLTCLLEWESRWVARRHEMPFGTSLVVVARKTNESSFCRSQSVTVEQKRALR